MAVVQHVSENVAVMYLGKIVELADKESIYKRALHPYTQALLQSIPIPNPHSGMKYKPLKGELPSPFDIPHGCRFHSRCDRAIGLCNAQDPLFKEVDKGHWVACHLY
jgi:oligopeptide/dipeptide ABC transporter ATP-binding protein